MGSAGYPGCVTRRGVRKDSRQGAGPIFTRERVKPPLPCRVSGFGGRACRNFGVRSEGTRFHLGASRRHGSHKEPDEWGARVIQVV